jgi:hypothetical protein
MFATEASTSHTRRMQIASNYLITNFLSFAAAHELRPNLPLRLRTFLDAQVQRDRGYGDKAMTQMRKELRTLLRKTRTTNLQYSTARYGTEHAAHAEARTLSASACQHLCAPKRRTLDPNVQALNQILDAWLVYMEEAIEQSTDKLDGCSVDKLRDSVPCVGAPDKKRSPPCVQAEQDAASNTLAIIPGAQSPHSCRHTPVQM